MYEYFLTLKTSAEQVFNIAKPRKLPEKVEFLTLSTIRMWKTI